MLVTHVLSSNRKNSETMLVHYMKQRAHRTRKFADEFGKFNERSE